jgi:hypothetical protein
VKASSEIVLDSPMEALFYGLCHFHEVPVLRVVMEARPAGDMPAWQWTALRVAVPRILTVHVEIGSDLTDSAMRPYRAAWRAQHSGSLVVLYREELDTLREASRPAQFAARLKAIDSSRLLDEKTW